MSRRKIIKFCTIAGCERPSRSNELCQYHYNKKDWKKIQVRNLLVLGVIIFIIYGLNENKIKYFVIDG